MKSIFISSIIVLFLSSFSFVSIDDVINGIRTGNASQVSKFFDNTVEIALPDKSNSYSKSQAELVLRDFFSNTIVRNFEVLHKGDNSGSQFCIGTLQTRNGEYRTTFYMKQKGDKLVLQELRFEK
jgi:hypothetical protein